MNPSDDKQLYLDMQEHPEKYSDQQLEAMMDRLDREPDAEAAWQRLQARLATKAPATAPRRQKAPSHMLRKVAATLLFACASAVLGYAGYKAFSPGRHRAAARTEVAAQKKPQAHEAAATPDSLFRFANVQLDSILSMVARHYGRRVVFRYQKARTLRLHTMWNSARPLSEFVEILNEFDAFRLTDQRDTLFVEPIAEEEEGK